jgi:hypothetical protein
MRKFRRLKGYIRVLWLCKYLPVIIYPDRINKVKWQGCSDHSLDSGNMDSVKPYYRTAIVSSINGICHVLMLYLYFQQ